MLQLSSVYAASLTDSDTDWLTIAAAAAGVASLARVCGSALQGAGGVASLSELEDAKRAAIESKDYAAARQIKEDIAALVAASGSVRHARHYRYQPGAARG